MDFTASTHGTLTLLEALTAAARKFLATFGFREKVALTFREFREVRFAALDAGLTFAS